MPTVLDWNPTVDPSTLIRTIREALAVGSAVVMPGDCGYVVLLNPAAATTAARLTGFGEPAVLAWGPDDPAGLGLKISVPVGRLFERSWPAPLAFVTAGRPEWPANWPTKLVNSKRAWRVKTNA